MIPDDKAVLSLWDTYRLPEVKRNHSSIVCRVALFFASLLNDAVDTNLLRASALLHDIDKAVGQRPGGRHPDRGVELLIAGGMREVAEVVRTHPLHAILDPATAPATWEQKLLYLADKMVKHDVVGVDGRFALWRAEQLPAAAVAELDAAYPKVKELEQEVAEACGLDVRDVTTAAAQGILGMS